MKAIYQIRNIVTGWVYIGSTANFYRRVKQHSESLVAKKHFNKHLQKAYNKYGNDNFVVEVLESYQSHEIHRGQLYEREQHYLDTTKHKYNILTQSRQVRLVTKIGIVVSNRLKEQVKKDIRHYTNIPGEFIKTTARAKMIKNNKGIVIRIVDSFYDNKHAKINKMKFDYVMHNTNPQQLIHKIENMLAKFGII